MKQHYTLFSLRSMALVCLLMLAAQVCSARPVTLRVTVTAPTAADAEQLRADIPSLPIAFSTDEALANDEWLGASFYTNTQSLTDLVPASLKASSRTSTLTYTNGGWTGTISNMESGYWYYRFYDIHLAKVVTGYIHIDADDPRVTITDLEDRQCLTFSPVIDRDGSQCDALIAPDVETGRVQSASYGLNVYSLDAESDYKPFRVYVPADETVHYIVIPSRSDNRRLAPHVGEVEMCDAPATVTTDYRQAVKLRAVIADTQGNNCNITSGQFGYSYYTSSSENYGYGFYNGVFGGGNDDIAANGTFTAYALPGEVNLEVLHPTVAHSDPDFMMPYNTPTGYVICPTTVKDGAAEQTVVMGQSDPRDVTVVLGARKMRTVGQHFNIQALTYYDYKFYPFGYKLENADMQVLSKKVYSSNVTFNVRVNGANPYVEFHLHPDFDERPDSLWMVEDFVFSCEFLDENRGQEILLRNDRMVSIIPVKFVVPCVLMAGDGNEIAINRATTQRILFRQKDHGTLRHADGCHRCDNDITACDTLVAYVMNDDYEWHLQKNDSTAYGKTYGFKAEPSQTMKDQQLPLTDYCVLRANDEKFGTVTKVFPANAESLAYRSAVEDGSGNGRMLWYADEVWPASVGLNEHAVSYRKATIDVMGLGNVNTWIDNVADDRLLGGVDTNPEHSSRGTSVMISKGTPDVQLFARYDGNGSATAYRFAISASDRDTVIHHENPVGNFSNRLYFKVGDDAVSLADVEDAIYVLQWPVLTYEPGVLDAKVGCTADNASHTWPYLWVVPGNYHLTATLLEKATGRTWSVEHDFVKERPILQVDLRYIVDGISDAAASPSATETARYGLDGRRLAQPQSGINIVRMSDGSVRKMMVK